MKLLIHLIKYNLIFNKVRFAFLTFLALVTFTLGSYFHESEVEFGQFLMQYSLYFLFPIMIGKINAKNNLMFDIKHLMALPLTKNQIVFTKALADVVEYVPLIFIFIWGIHLGFPDYHVGFGLILVPGILFCANMISFNKRIDFSRMQHSRASFKNSILYVHKYLEMMILMTIASLLVAGVLIGAKQYPIYQEYGLTVLLCLGIFFSFNSTLKMLKDETRSYFIIKRDILRIGWKLAAIGLPLIFLKNIEQLAKGPSNMQVLANIVNSKKMINEDIKKKSFLLSLINNNEKAFNEFLSDNSIIPWDTEIIGNYPAHLVAKNGNITMMKKLFKLRPESIDKAGKNKQRTPLFVSLATCEMPMVEYLLEKKVNINHQDSNGDTPLHYALKNHCLGGAVLLSRLKELDISLINKKKKLAFDFLKDGSSIAYIIRKQQGVSNKKSKREVASKKSSLGVLIKSLE